MNQSLALVAPVCLALAAVMFASAPALGQNLSKATFAVRGAQSLLESRRIDDVAGKLEEAEAAMVGLTDAEKAPLLAQIATIRAELAKAQSEEERRVLKSRIERMLRSAEGSIGPHTHQVEKSLADAEMCMTSKDAARLFTPDELGAFRAKALEVRALLAKENKDRAIERAEDFLGRLEEDLRDDPYKDKSEWDAYKASTEIEYHYRAVKLALEGIPVDSDVRAVLDKQAAFRKRIDAAAGAWSTAQVEATILNSWKSVADRVEGWRDETPKADARPNEQWRLEKTVSALRNAQYWLELDQTQRLRKEHGGNAVVKGTIAEAEGVRDEAAAKLDAAFAAAIGQAEKLPTPTNRFDRQVAPWMAVDAEEVFKGTKHQRGNVARAKALDERWEKEIVAREKAAAELRAKLSAEAEKAWKEIVASIEPEEEFDASRLARSKGDVIIIRGMHNRAGWDFDGSQFDFAVRIDGVAIGGNYEKYIDEHVRKVWDTMKAPPLSDREPWDIIAEVVGKAQVRRRVTTTLIAEETREVIGKIEGHEPEDGVELRIIGLRAGPVAVGRK